MNIETDSITALVIEQDHESRVKLRNLLEESLGLTVFSAASPAEGLAVLKKIKPPAVVLLSTRVSLMSFEEFLDQKGRVGPAASAPVILLSPSALASLPPGVSAWVRSPVDPSALTEAILRTTGLSPR
jgi:CheY-like chemotaxis protein